MQNKTYKFYNGQSMTSHKLTKVNNLPLFTADSQYPYYCDQMESQPPGNYY